MDVLIPLAKAANRYNVTELQLQQLIQTATIRSMSYGGVVLVSEEEVEQNLPREERPEYKQFSLLRGKGIGMREASRTYKVPQPTIRRWVQAGFIAVLGQEGRKTLIDEADVAYCAFIYKRDAGQGKWTFARNGTPYNPKRKK